MLIFNILGLFHNFQKQIYEKKSWNGFSRPGKTL